MNNTHSLELSPEFSPSLLTRKKSGSYDEVESKKMEEIARKSIPILLEKRPSRAESLDTLLSGPPILSKRIDSLGNLVDQLIKGKKRMTLVRLGSGFEVGIESKEYKGEGSPEAIAQYFKVFMEEVILTKDPDLMMRLTIQFHRISQREGLKSHEVFNELTKRLAESAEKALLNQLAPTLNLAKTAYGPAARELITTITMPYETLKRAVCPCFSTLFVNLDKVLKELQFREDLLDDRAFLTTMLGLNQRWEKVLQDNIGWTIDLKKFDELTLKCLALLNLRYNPDRLGSLLLFCIKAPKVDAMDQLISLAEKKGDCKDHVTLLKASWLKPNVIEIRLTRNSFVKSCEQITLRVKGVRENRDKFVLSLASDMRIYYSKLFCQIAQAEFINCGSLNKSDVGPIQEACHFSNQIGPYIKSSIFFADRDGEIVVLNEKGVRRMVKFYVDLCMALISLHHYAAAFDLYSVLNSSLISELKVLDRKRKEQLQKWDLLFSHEGNFNLLRKALSDKTGKRPIPPLALILKDFAAIDGGSKTLYDGLFNGSKMKMISKKIREFKELQSALQTNELEETDFIKNMQYATVYGEDQLLVRSKQLFGK